MPSSRSSRNSRILVADDNDLFRQGFTRVLRNAGYQVVEACDGQKALTALKNNPVDLVITDIFMPEQDGLSLLKELRQMHSPPPVIAMSGGGQFPADQFLHMAEAMGAFLAIEKPFQVDEIRSLIQAALTGRSPD